ncbi:MAG: esterase [Sideroxydans sp.]|nr:esterase [Sideroxydans sp.]
MHQYKYISALLAALLLVGCGGGGAGDQTPKVKFTSQVSFGDSLSDVGSYKVGPVAAAGGGQFTVNGGGRNWTELMAAQSGLPVHCAALTGGFGVAATASAACTGYAEGGARVTNPIGIGYNTTTPAAGAMTVPVVTQIANHLAAVGGSFSGGEIVYVWAGANDIFAQLGGLTAAVTAQVGADIASGACVPADAQATNCVPAATTKAVTAAVTAVATAAGELVALVNTQMIAKGATHVVILNIPDMTSTPSALTLSASAKGILGTMVDTYNAQLKTGVAGNAKVLLVDINTVNKDQIANPAIYGLSNVTGMACDMTVAIQAPAAFNATSLVCNTSNVIAGSSNYLFADGSGHPTPYVHVLIARLVSKEMIVKGWM